MSAFAGIRRWFHLDRPVEDEVDEELAFHFERAADELVASGMSREAAQAEARRRFGDVSDYRRQLKEIDQTRRTEQRRTEYFSLFARHMRLAWRTVQRNPGFAAVVGLTMGLGIGINASMFTLLDRLLFTQPALIPQPEQVRRVYVTRNPLGDWIFGASMTYPDVVDLKAAKSLTGAIAYTTGPLAFGHGESVQMLPVTIAEPGWFELLGVRPVIGRFLEVADDSAAEGLANAVISYGFWQRQFGGSASALGQKLELGDGRYTVVGVAPDGFTGIDVTRNDVWLPLTPASVERVSGDWKTNRHFYWIRAVARVKDGVPIARAETEATALHLAGHADDKRYSKQQARITLGPLLEARGPASDGQAKVSIWAAGVSIAVLLVACANVANLLLFRAIRRRREIAIRLALGVSRRQLVAELLTESLLLALIGGIGALLLTFYGSGLLHRLLQPDLASTLNPLSWRVAGFTIVVALGAGLVAGLIPAWLESRPDLLSALKEATAGSGGHHVIRSGLVIMQTALSVTLLVGAGLFLISLQRLRATDMGLAADQVLVVTPQFPRGFKAVEQQRIFRDGQERLSRIPGVTGVSMTAGVPYNWSWAEALTIPGIDSIPTPRTGGPYVDAVGANYFETMGMRMVEGRGFQDGDVAGAPLVAVMGESMAHTLWPGQSALGKCLKFGDDNPPCREIVGVVRDTKRSMGMIKDGDVRLQYYLPLTQLVDMTTPGTFVLRSTEPLKAAGPAREMLQQLAPSIRYIESATFEEIYNPDFQSWRTGAGLFTAFGGLALLVAGVGLYSLLAYGVAQRTREIGVRIALGARPTGVIGLVLQQGVVLVAIGVVVGLGIALFAAKAAAPLLFQTEPTEPSVYLAVSAVLLGIAVLAGALPAWRATRVSPMTALRAE